MNLTEAEAESLLDSLLARGGILKIISSEVKPEFRVDPDNRKSGPKVDTNIKDPASMVLLDVVSLGYHPVRTTHLVASAEDGSFVESYDGPIALLYRLLDWRYYDVVNEAATAVKVAAAAEAMYEALSTRVG